MGLDLVATFTWLDERRAGGRFRIGAFSRCRLLTLIATGLRRGSKTKNSPL